MHTQWTDQLSAYLDDELAPEARSAVDAHLSRCAECRGVLEDLRALVVAAPAYVGTAPAPAVWGRIAAGIEADRSVSFPSRPARRYSLGQMLAAAAVVALVAAGGVWSVMRPGPAAPSLAGGEAGGETVLVSAGSPFDDPAYASAIEELEATLEAGRAVLDSATIRVVEENLAVIDAAIDEARTAIAADPSNAYLGARVKLHMQRKLVLLRQAVRAAGAAT